MRILVAALSMSLVAGAAGALPPEKGDTAVVEAKKLLGVPYDLGGRMKAAGDGIDCQGLVFFALQPLSTCGWRSWSVMPTASVAAEELGARVEGLAPVATAALDVTKLRAGDVIHFVGFDENKAEPSIAQLDGKPVWVWHMGLASGGGRFVVGDHFAGAVVEEDLKAYLAAHADDYAGVFITRMSDGPKSAKCRRHAPMLAPSTSAAHAPTTR